MNRKKNNKKMRIKKYYYYNFSTTRFTLILSRFAVLNMSAKGTSPGAGCAFPSESTSLTAKVLDQQTDNAQRNAFNEKAEESEGNRLGSFLDRKGSIALY